MAVEIADWVFNERGQPITSGVTVEAYRSDTGALVATTSVDASGRWAFEGATALADISPNYYKVKIVIGSQVRWRIGGVKWEGMHKLTLTPPPDLSVGASGSAGTAFEAARSDHVHRLNLNLDQAPVNQAIGDSASAGSSSALARADHKHGMPSFGGNGSATTVARSDHHHDSRYSIGGLVHLGGGVGTADNDAWYAVGGSRFLWSAAMLPTGKSVYLECVLRTDQNDNNVPPDPPAESAVVYVELREVTGLTVRPQRNTVVGTLVTGSQINNSGATTKRAFNRVRSGALTLTDAKEYVLYYKGVGIGGSTYAWVDSVRLIIA